MCRAPLKYNRTGRRARRADVGIRRLPFRPTPGRVADSSGPQVGGAAALSITIPGPPTSRSEECGEILTSKRSVLPVAVNDARTGPRRSRCTRHGYPLPPRSIASLAFTSSLSQSSPSRLVYADRSRWPSGDRAVAGDVPIRLPVDAYVPADVLTHRLPNVTILCCKHSA